MAVNNMVTVDDSGLNRIPFINQKLIITLTHPTGSRVYLANLTAKQNPVKHNVAITLCCDFPTASQRSSFNSQPFVFNHFTQERLPLQVVNR